MSEHEKRNYIMPENICEKNKRFLPVTPEEVHERGYDVPDFVYVCGDAYVDHPSFGMSIISRVL